MVTARNGHARGLHSGRTLPIPRPTTWKIHVLDTIGDDEGRKDFLGVYMPFKRIA